MATTDNSKADLCAFKIFTHYCRLFIANIQLVVRSLVQYPYVKTPAVFPWAKIAAPAIDHVILELAHNTALQVIVKRAFLSLIARYL
jgi:hypothetical protein